MAILGFCLALLLPAGRPLSAQQNGGGKAAEPAGVSNVTALLNDGLTRFREGNFAQAAAAFEKAFALDPTQDQIARFLEQANLAVVMQMVRSEDLKVSGYGKTLLKLSYKTRQTRASDQEGIKAAIDKVFSSRDEQERLIGMLEGARRYGRNLIPLLLPKLGSPESSVRTTAFLWATKVEIDGIPPLIAAARHPNTMVRLNVARILGTRPVRDGFSLGALSGLIETDSDPEVKKAAQESREAILRDIGAKKPLAAKEYHLRYARLLYQKPHLNRFASPEYLPAVFTLRGEEVVGEQVAPFQLSLRMAEEELVEALRLDPAFAEAKVQKLLSEALQVVEYDDAVVFYGSPQAADADVKALLEKQKETQDTIRRLRIRAYSKDVLYAALHSAIKEKRPEVAEKLLEVIQENRLRGPVPGALVEALTESSSRLVRIAAAVTLSRWNPQDTAEFGDAVVGLLAEAAVSSGIRTVHKVMGNPDNVSRFDSMFRDLNLESGTNVPDVALALQRAVNLPPDLIMIDEEARQGARETAPVNAFISEIRKSYRTATTPVVVVVGAAKIEEKKALYQNEEKKVLVVAADCDRATLKTQVLDKLFAETDDAKARATRLAARAAEALQALTSGPTAFPVAQAAGPLARVLENRPDEVRVPALLALGNLGKASLPALSPIALVHANAENAVPVREAAMLAVSRILSSGAVKAPEDVLKTIRAGMEEADPKLREASWVAFGSAGASDGAQLEALTLGAKVPQVAAAGTPPAEGGEKPAAPGKPAGKPAAGKAGEKAGEGEEKAGGDEPAEKDAPADAGGATEGK